MKFFNFFLIFLGIALLILNAVGLLKSDNDKPKVKSIFKNENQISYDQAVLFFDTVNKTNKLYFAKSANDVVSKRILHAWTYIDEKDHLKLDVTVSPDDNYLLWLASFISEKYKKYFFHDSYMGLKRGLGQCGQQSHILYTLLNDHGVDAYEIGLNGHVVVGADINGKSIVLDPDYNIFIPHGINEIVHDTSIVRHYYAGIDTMYARSHSVISTEEMKHLYGKGDFFTSKEKPVTVGWKYGLVERLTYIFKWLIPLCFIIIGFRFLLK